MKPNNIHFDIEAHGLFTGIGIDTKRDLFVDLTVVVNRTLLERSVRRAVRREIAFVIGDYAPEDFE